MVETTKVGHVQNSRLFCFSERGGRVVGKVKLEMNAVVPPESGRNVNDGAAEMIQRYRAWEGSNKFCLGGRFIFGPDVRFIVLTIFLIVAPAAIFCVFVARKLRTIFLGIGETQLWLYFLFSRYMSLLTFGIDPGIIPRTSVPPAHENFEGSEELVSGQKPRLPRTRDVIINGVTVKVKYCETCLLYRPPRCSHCSIATTVERFDRHCP